MSRLLGSAWLLGALLAVVWLAGPLRADPTAVPAPTPGPGTGFLVAELLDRAKVGPEALRSATALQPALRFGNRAGGLRGFFDRAERFAPLALKNAWGWGPSEAHREFEDAVSGRRLDHAEALAYWGRRGAAFYLDLPEQSEGRLSMLHRYLYLFGEGEGLLLGRTGPHVVWVEVRERLDPSPQELEIWRARTASDLEGKRDALLAMRTGERQPGRLAVIDEALASLARIMAGPLDPPLHQAVEEVLVSDPMPIDGGRFRIRRYARDQLRFSGDRVELWVSEGNHRFLASPGELSWFEECDQPWIVEPRHDGRLPLIDLRDFEQPENPLRLRAIGESLPELPGFLDSPALVVGFRQLAARRPDLFEVPPR